MKITSLFSRISQGTSETITENGNDISPKPNSTIISSPISAVSSPDIIPPSPVFNKNRSIKAKRNLNSLLINNEEYKNKLTVSHTSSVSHVSKIVLDLNKKSPENSKEDNYDIDSQSIIGTESMGSTICDDTDFCSDLVFDDWVDSSSLTTK